MNSVICYCNGTFEPHPRGSIGCFLSNPVYIVNSFVDVLIAQIEVLTKENERVRLENMELRQALKPNLFQRIWNWLQIKAGDLYYGIY